MDSIEFLGWNDFFLINQSPLIVDSRQRLGHPDRPIPRTGNVISFLGVLVLEPSQSRTWVSSSSSLSSIRTSTWYFHHKEYVQLLRKITPDNGRQYSANMQRFNVGGTANCPVFEDLFEFNQYTSEPSIDPNGFIPVPLLARRIKTVPPGTPPRVIVCIIIDPQKQFKGLFDRSVFSYWLSSISTWGKWMLLTREMGWRGLEIFSVPYHVSHPAVWCPVCPRWDNSLKWLPSRNMAYYVVLECRTCQLYRPRHPLQYGGGQIQEESPLLLIQHHLQRLEQPHIFPCCRFWPVEP